MTFRCQLILQISIIVNMASQSQSDVSEVKDMAKSNTHFTFDLLRQCAAGAKGKNVFFAPYSITTALAMTYMGARGKTAEEMKSVLKWPSDVPKKGFGSYLALLKDAAAGETPGYVLVGAQRIYVDGHLTLKPDFSSATTEHFVSQAAPADFRNNAENERQKINAWVSEQTRNKIKDLLPGGSLDAMTAMVLVQALYFKGNWMHKFDAKNTHPADFFITPDETVKVDMMEQTRNFNYGVSQKLKCSAVELPYVNNNVSADSATSELSMLILLPDAKDGLEQLEADLSYNDLKSIKLHSMKVNLKMPRFSMESSFELKGVLSKLGMPHAFGDAADFSGMVTSPVPLSISEVFHKAVVDVNEEGSEAAAATAVVMMRKSLPVIKPFIADHPFLFFIMDQRADVVLFAGRLVKPPSAGSSQQKEEL